MSAPLFGCADGGEIMNFYTLLDGYEPYKQLKKDIDTGKTPVSVCGVVESAKAQLIAALCSGRSTLCVVYSDFEARALYDELCFYTDRAYLFCEKEYVFHNIDTRAHMTDFDRLAALDRIGGGGVFVASVGACMSYTLPKDKLAAGTHTVKIGDKLDADDFCAQLTEAGYTRADTTEAAGQFSVRGGIIDVYSPGSDSPCRIELFDDEVDSIRFFDPLTQRSHTQTDECRIIPASELCLTADERAKLSGFLQKSARAKNCSEELEKTLAEECERLGQNCGFPAIDKYAGVIYEEIPTIVDYFDNASPVFIVEPKRINERAKTLEWERAEMYDELAGRGGLPPKTAHCYALYRSICEKLAEKRLVGLNLLAHSAIDYRYADLVDFVTKSTVSLHGKIDYLYDDLAAWKSSGATVVILAQNSSRGKNLAGTLTEKGFDAVYAERGGDFAEKKITVMRGEAKKGYEYPEIGFVLIAEQDIFTAQKNRKKRKADSANRIKSYTDVNVGDYVVHRAHGIGQYEGIKKLEVGGVTKDYLKIKYNGTDVLYVPVDQMDMLYKYVGSGEKAVHLNKLGGSEWNKTKQRVKTATADMAKQLVALYAEREHTKGHAFSGDTPWQRDFEDTFAYSETADQLRSIEEVKADMENDRPMDRLLCGDVGYGKTEVALRAAFKAAADSKQVAYLCPTTILAMQHYETFRSRMADFPIKVEMLSRFRTPKEQEKIIKKVKTGEIDIIIGTHRLLQKDVVFRDVGLLIIDEEQRFGVADKERIKELKKNVDVLSMTATPIPRTLHMAMLSVRDMSLLETPPENRYPVETYVLEYNAQILADAMKKELARGGQVFYLYNRIQGIYTVADRIRKLIPEARVVVGHGRMREEELEDIMYDMVNGEADILVCTTIIETGLDIPNANTIIIENADRMGLSQLYQLRGRVGRSNRSAYAYLCYKRDGVLSETAQKRLSAIREFTEFGSGFKIAMRDLEIRGAGNILGAQQHGHMDSVGYDMYCRLLAESVREAQGISANDDISTSIDVSVDAFIPEKYIRNPNRRIDVYKQIAAVTDADGASDITDELIDRFGTVPRSVLNLIDIALIKADAAALGIEEISENGRALVFTFGKGTLAPETAVALIKKMPYAIKVGSGEIPKISYFPKAEKKKIANIKFMLQTILSLNSGEK